MSRLLPVRVRPGLSFLFLSAAAARVFTQQPFLTETLSLGLDLNGAQTRTASTFNRQLQLTVGGSYQVTKKATFDFALLAGWYSAPRVGVLIGTSITP